MAMQTQAGKYAEKFGYQNLAEQGMGEEFNRGLTETAFSRIRQSTVQNRDQGISKLENAGMNFTGVREVKLPNLIAGQNAEQAFSEVNNIVQQDQQFKLDMGRRWIDILKYEDNYAIQQEQLALQRKAQEKDLFDIMGEVGSIVSAFATL